MPLAHLNGSHVSAQSNGLTGLTGFDISERWALSAREITVDGEIEPSTASKLTFHLKLCADGPDVFRAKLRLRSVTLFAVGTPKLPAS